MTIEDEKKARERAAEALALERRELTGVLTIHAQAHREVPPAACPSGYETAFLVDPGRAWLHYRSIDGDIETTFSRALVCLRDAELGRCGEATREKRLSV